MPIHPLQSLQQKGYIPRMIKKIEKILALVVIASVLAYTIASIPLFFNLPWSHPDTFYQFIYRILQITIGLELARMLVTHSFLAILELLAFVVARKMLEPEIGTTEIFLGVIAFVAILVAHRFCIVPLKVHEEQKHSAT
jgi:hypothetical protein